MTDQDPRPNSTSDKESTPGPSKKYTSPFTQFDISSTDVLDTIEKAHCPTCNRNCRYFCYKCLNPVNCPEGAIPHLKLPIKLDIIKHEQERDGKSTALHAKILAPDDVEVYAFKEMPKYENVDRLLLLFPSPGAKQLSEIDPSSFDKLVVIDGTWDQANKMSKSDSPLLRMKRDSEASQVITPHKEWISTHQLGPYTNQFDDMLWFYKYFYELIQKTYRERTDGKEFTLKHKKGYIQYDTDGPSEKKESDGQTTAASAPSLPASTTTTSEDP
ncbi:DTW domain-containing protein 1 [Gryganskiella cystojenkinii]|nr:DTW domain-containing protein 1 [Gryganskiella cystojenkinii]